MNHARAPPLGLTKVCADDAAAYWHTFDVLSTDLQALARLMEVIVETVKRSTPKISPHASAIHARAKQIRRVMAQTQVGGDNYARFANCVVSPHEDVPKWCTGEPPILHDMRAFAEQAVSYARRLDPKAVELAAAQPERFAYLTDVRATTLFPGIQFWEFAGKPASPFVAATTASRDRAVRWLTQKLGPSPIWASETGRARHRAHDALQCRRFVAKFEAELHRRAPRDSMEGPFFMTEADYVQSVNTAVDRLEAFLAETPLLALATGMTEFSPKIILI